MKKLKLLFLLSLSFLFISCVIEYSSSDDSISYDFPEDSYYYTIPADAEEICFPEEHDGKKLYLIYTNEKSFDLQKGSDGIIDENCNKTTGERSISEPEISISRSNINDKNKYQREEVHFNIPKIKPSSNSSLPQLKKVYISRTNCASISSSISSMFVSVKSS